MYMHVYTLSLSPLSFIAKTLVCQFSIPNLKARVDVEWKIAIRACDVAKNPLVPIVRHRLIKSYIYISYNYYFDFYRNFESW